MINGMSLQAREGATRKSLLAMVDGRDARLARAREARGASQAESSGLRAGRTR